MATILLSAVGASIGASFGGTVLGLSTAVIGRAVGASLGRVIDQRVLGQGAQAVETGRIDRLRLQAAGEGTAIARIWGQMRVPGHVVWAAPLEEVRRKTGGGGGKGAPSGPEVTEISYRLSAAFALCEGTISGVGRVWADGEEIDPADLGMRVYPGDEAQLPDPCLAAHLGEEAPAFRGIAYVVVERLNLERWGNRVPLLTFEVTRTVPGGTGLAQTVEAVALIPGTGEYTLATTPLGVDLGLGETRMVNRNTASDESDLAASLKSLAIELPRVRSVSLVVSWFGDDLRCGDCTIRPKVENDSDARGMAWRAGGIARPAALQVPRVDGRSVYGGTPADASVVEAIRALTARGMKPVFYPFVLMDQLAGNGRRDPWTGAPHQPVLPWRGRITGSRAAGQTGSPDGTAAATAEVAAFFGAAMPQHFTRSGGQVRYDGPAQDWGYRRFILHYAHLCALAGGVDAFIIGSEMVGLTQIRGEGGSYPAVAALVALARDVRGILGPGVKLGYAADWTEYAGHRPGGLERRFHLDPLWAAAEIDFVGIDNYLPLTDWRDGETHLDADWRRADNPGYLRAGIEGGELYDWYYADDAHRAAQLRTPITDGAHDEPWIWRQKDLRGWWENAHHERDAAGNRAAAPTPWVPRSKPIWFTELGCAALDKASNEPNKFLDLRSSESALPRHSDGSRDDALQAAFFAAVNGYWSDPERNPVGIWGGRMIDTARIHAWCWDARPYPAFPARGDLWADGSAWARGHWLNGRAGAVPLADVVGEICAAAGVAPVDVSGLSGTVRGFLAEGGETPRALLQSLMLVHGFDAVESGGVLRFRMRDGWVDRTLGADDLAEDGDLHQPQITRAPEAELSGRVRITHLEAGTDYETSTAEAVLPDAPASRPSTDSEFAMALTRTEGRALAERWLAEARVARDAVKLALPPSRGVDLAPGDVVRLDTAPAPGRWRVDRIERAGAVTIEATRVEPGVYRAPRSEEEAMAARVFVPPVPVLATYLDLPLLRGDEVPHAPHVAIAATPWPGSAAVYSADEAEGGFTLNRLVTQPAIVGVTETPLAAARAGMLDRGPPLRVAIKGGSLRSVSPAALLGGANAMAIGDGTPDGWEVLQFATATLVAPGVWELSDRLRGQAGTDALMPEVWPAGSQVVLLDGAPVQLDLAPAVRGQLRLWRAGPAMRGVADPSYSEVRLAFAGVGLRPYAPCHLRLEGRRLSWVRRTRISGDGWDGADVPLGEAREAYRVRLVRAGTLLAETMVGEPAWAVPASIWSAAAAGGPFEAEVAQLSDVYGAGPAARRVIDV